MSQKLTDKFTGHTAGSILKDDPRFQDKQPYQAYGIDQSKNRQMRIDIRDKDGNGFLISYSYLTRIQYTGNEFLSLICTDCLVTLKGANLQLLRNLLHDEKIRYVQAYSQARFVEPKEGEPIIRDIAVFEMIGKFTEDGNKTL